MLICFALLLTLSGRAQTPTFQWAKRVASTTNPDRELAIGLAIDSAANLYVTGWFDGTNDFGGVILTNQVGQLGGGQDIFVAKYSSSGALQWAHRAGSSLPGSDTGRGIGLDNAGNVYVTGGFVGYADFDGIVLSGGTERQFYLANYDSQGRVQWVRQSSGPGEHYATGLAVDGAGNSYALGYIDSLAIVAFDVNLSVTNDLNGYGTFLVKYNSAGDGNWAKLIGSSDQSYSTSVAVDTNGNVYASGEFKGTLFVGNTNLVSTGGKNGFLAKFSGAGVFQWARQMNTTSDVVAPAVCVDRSGHLYVAGGFGNTNGDAICFSPALCLTNSGGGLAGVGVGDAFLARYDRFTGTPQAAARLGGMNADAYFGVSTDTQGNVYAAGALGGTRNIGGFKALVAQYDSDGMVQWFQSSTGNYTALALAGPVVDLAGNCYVAGWFQTNAVFGLTTLTGRGYWDFFLAKLGRTPLSLGLVWSNSVPRLSVSGDRGTRFALEFISVLAATNNWHPLLTNTVGASPFIHTDTSSSGDSARFYRTRVVP